MADVRSMLRAERANRRITHPNASYTGDGKLLCSLCSTMIKSEGAWGSHLHSTQHTLNLSKAQEAAASRGEGAGKKRKAERLESPSVADDRKRARGEEDEDDDEDDDDTPRPAEKKAKESATVEETKDLSVQPPQPAVAEVNVDDELAAFERDIAALESRDNNASAASAAFNTSATISAAPMTAEEVAAQAREELSAQRGQRDAEIAAEKEDAAKLLEDEFEEMEGLEERVRKMRERREALRKGATGGNDANGVTQPKNTAQAEPTEANNSEDEDDEDDYDDWGFGAD